MSLVATVAMAAMASADHNFGPDIPTELKCLLDKVLEEYLTTGPWYSSFPFQGHGSFLWPSNLMMNTCISSCVYPVTDPALYDGGCHIIACLAEVMVKKLGYTNCRAVEKATLLDGPDGQEIIAHWLLEVSISKSVVYYLDFKKTGAVLFDSNPGLVARREFVKFKTSNSKVVQRFLVNAGATLPPDNNAWWEAMPKEELYKHQGVYPLFGNWKYESDTKDDWFDDFKITWDKAIDEIWAKLVAGGAQKM